jgi:hypothetical protein
MRRLEGSIWPFSRSASSISASGVPPRAVITSSVGFVATMPRQAVTSSTSPRGSPP